MNIVVGIPAYNEEKNIAKIALLIKEHGYSAMVCNDGSTDLTGQIAEKVGAIVINH
ncbi:MAG: glycosyltransferase, partial [Candidatus Nitrosotenuis sp.]